LLENNPFFNKSIVGRQGIMMVPANAYGIASQESDAVLVRNEREQTADGRAR
jgi:hypothetical protein